MVFPRRKKYVEGYEPKAENLSILQFNMYAHGAFAGETDEDFVVRRAANIEHIQQVAPTITVMEEVDDPQLYDVEMKAMGYRYYGSKKQSGQGDWTCVWYKEGAVEVESVEEFKFSSGSQFAMIAKLKFASKQFILIAQHAKAGRSEDAETTRLKQSMELFAHIEEVQKELPAPLPIIWVGDMNASDSAHEGKYPNRWYPAAVGGIETAVDSEVSWKNPVSFTSAMVDARGCEPNFTTCKMRDGQLLCHTIDYILLERGKFKCVGYLEDVSSADALAPTYLPHPQWGSDHLSLFAEIVFQ